MGRPRGLPDRPKRAAISEWATSAHGLPSKRLLYASNWWLNQVAEEQRKPGGGSREVIAKALQEACNYAAMAMPYVERRLASVTHQNLPYDLSKLTDEELGELDRITRRALDTEGFGGTGNAPTSH